MMHLTVIFKSTIMCQQFYSLFILFTFLTTNALAIKVDFNTNTGPIIPPTSTEAPVPKPPFREPAPVWEDQSDDIPNPHPYKYVAPPTTRPRYNDPFGDKSVQRSTVPPQHGNIVYHPNQIHDQNNKIVNSLTVKYIPNYGNKYVAVVPATTKVQYLNNNEIYDNLSNDNNNYYDNNNNNNNNNYNNKNVNNFNNNDYNYNYYDDISHNKYDKYRKYEKYDNLQKSNSKYRLKNKKYNAYEEKKKYWPIYLYHIPHQQQVYVYNYQT